MAEYHVGCGLFGIYAGTLKNPQEWRNKSEVTDEELNKRLDEIYGTYYDKVIDEFKKNFGFFPIWVKEWK